MFRARDGENSRSSGDADSRRSPNRRALTSLRPDGPPHRTEPGPEPSSRPDTHIDGRPSTDFVRHATLQQLPRIEGLARRRFPDAVLADEAVSYVLDTLQADDWARARRWRGEARFESYLVTVATRLLEDFARARLGRVRIPAWVQAQGPLWELVYRLLCLERHGLHAVIEIARGGAPEGRNAALVEAAARAIRARDPRCGAADPAAASPLSLDEVAPPPDPETPDSQLAEAEAAARRQALTDLLLGDAETADSGVPVNKALAEDLRQRLHLSSEERLLLKLIYQDGLTVTAAGAMLGYSVHQTHGRLRRLLARIRGAVEAAGLTRGEALG